MTTDNTPDPLLWSAHRERAKRWASTDLRGYPTLSAEAETEATLAAEPKAEQLKEGSTNLHRSGWRILPIALVGLNTRP